MAPSAPTAGRGVGRDPRAPDAARNSRLYGEVWEPYKETRIIRGRTTLSVRAVKASPLFFGDEFAAQLKRGPGSRRGISGSPEDGVERAAPTICSTSARPTDRHLSAIEMMMLAARALGVGMR